MLLCSVHGQHTYTDVVYHRLRKLRDTSVLFFFLSFRHREVARGGYTIHDTAIQQVAASAASAAPAGPATFYTLLIGELTRVSP